MKEQRQWKEASAADAQRLADLEKQLGAERAGRDAAEAKLAVLQAGAGGWARRAGGWATWPRMLAWVGACCGRAKACVQRSSWLCRAVPAAWPPRPGRGQAAHVRCMR